MMTAANIEILTAYDTLDMSVDQIADEFPEYEVSAIKAVLLAHSRKYRQAFIDGLIPLEDTGISNDYINAAPCTGLAGQTNNISPNKANEEKKTEDISDEEFDEINQAYKKLALYAENESVREKALRTLRDEKRGRLPAQVESKTVQLQKVQVNILEFNEMLKRAKAVQAQLPVMQGRVIDLPKQEPERILEAQVS